MKTITLTLTALLCVAATAGADTLVTSWENDAEGWSGFDGFSDTDGVTEGSYSAYRTPGGSWESVIRTRLDTPEDKWSILQGHTQLLLDVTFNDPVASWQVFEVVCQILGGATQGTGENIVGVISDGSTATDPGQVTLTFDYSAYSQDIIDNGFGWGEIRLITHCYGGYSPGPIYYDNFRATGALALAGDANGDGQVDGNDLISVEENFGATGDPYIAGDANGDGQVDGNDLISVEENFGATSGGESVPEPATMLLLGLGAAAGLIRRK